MKMPRQFSSHAVSAIAFALLLVLSACSPASEGGEVLGVTETPTSVEQDAVTAETVTTASERSPDAVDLGSLRREAEPGDVERGDDVNAYVGLEITDLTADQIEAMSDEQFRAMATNGGAASESLTCLVDWMIAELGREQIAAYSEDESFLPAGELRNQFDDAYIECGALSEVLVLLTGAIGLTLDPEAAECLQEAAATEAYGRKFLARTYNDAGEDKDLDALTSTELGVVMVDLAGC